ncbi:MAG: hypothetical protein J5649_08205 [Lachnospiraceae bacterium]|nr:hypothetical protein [Lachnospiraceae bacterium]
MVSTFEHDYPITGVRETNEVYDSYLCRNVAGGGLCSILCIHDRSCFPSLVGWLTEVVDPRAFTDFIEYFNFNDDLCIVMKYKQGLSLEKKLATEALTLAERLELGRKILERAVLQEIPEYFLDKCFSPDCIMVEPDLTVSFNYPIEDIMGDRQCSVKDNIERVMRLLFDRELQRKVPTVLIEFIDRLPELTEGSIIDLYSEYYALCMALEGYGTDSELPRTFSFRFWEGFKKVFGKVKTVFIVLLVLVAFAYLFYTMFDPGKSKVKDPQFDRIGTVQIDKNR